MRLISQRRMLLLFALVLSATALPARVRVDHAGRRVEVPERPQRIVSLAPGLTETLFSLGLGERVAGVTDYCDFPAEARAKPKVGGMINPSVETIVGLKPDLVLLTREGNRWETLEALERLKINVFAISVERLDDIFRMMREVADLAGVTARGEEAVRRLEHEAAEIEKAVRGQPPRRVVFVVWLQPLVSVGGGTFLDDLLRRAGADSISSGTSQPWPHLSIEEIVRRAPEYVLVPKTPWFAPTREEFLRLPGWRDLKAIQENHIIHLPSAAERPGPRLVEIQALIARALHAQAFSAVPSSPRISPNTGGTNPRGTSGSAGKPF